MSHTGEMVTTEQSKAGIAGLVSSSFLCAKTPPSPSRAAVPEHHSCGHCQDSPHLVAGFACFQAEPKAFDLFSYHKGKSSSPDYTRSPSAAGTGASTNLQIKCATQHNHNQVCQGFYQLVVPPGVASTSLLGIRDNVWEDV